MKSLLLICFALVILIPSVGAQSNVSVIERLPDGSYLVRIDSQAFWAVDAARTAILHKAEQSVPSLTSDLKQCEGDLLKTQNNLQDERVQIGRVRADYEAQTTLLSDCMKLHGGKGVSGFVNNPWFKLITSTAPTVVQVATCH